MFKWFRRRRVAFRYFDGRRRCVADPVVILRNLEKHGGEHWHDLVVSAGRPTDPNRYPIPAPGGAVKLFQEKKTALQDVAELTCKAFELQPLDKQGRGLTEAEQIGVLARYLKFVGGLAEEARPFVSSPPPASTSPTSTEDSSPA